MQFNLNSPYSDPPVSGAHRAGHAEHQAAPAAGDGHDGRPRFSTGGSAALSLAASACTSDGFGDGEIRQAAHLICRDAHRDGLSAEQMLIALKLEWSALPEVVAMRNRPVAEELLSRIVTVCIHEYYLSTPQADSGSTL